MTAQPVDDALTNVKIPAAARRRRKLPSMDPRRAPEDVAAGPLDEPATDSQLGDRPRRSREPRAAASDRDRNSCGGRRYSRRGEDHADDARRLSHARPQRRCALCRQGAQPEEPGAELHPSRGIIEPIAANGGRDGRDGDRLDPHRGGSAAARMQSDQAADAALQCSVARRQIVSADPSDRRSRLSAADQVSRREEPERQLFRPVRLGGGGQSHPGDPAKGVSAALVQRQHLRQPHSPVSAASDQAVQRAVRRADQPRGVCRPDRPGACLSVGRQRRGAADVSRPRCRRPPRHSISRRPG